GSNATLQTIPPCPPRVRLSVVAVASQILTVLSLPAETSRRPSGLKATLDTYPPRKVRISRPLPTFQTLMVWSRQAAASRWPSGLNATRSTIVRLDRMRVACHVVVSQSITVWSSPAEASNELGLLGWKATPRTSAACPLRVLVSRPVVASHTLIVRSPLAETSQR